VLGELGCFVLIGWDDEQFALRGKAGVETLGIRIELGLGLMTSVEKNLEQLALDVVPKDPAGIAIR
jgi:hypothetical protein